MTSTIYQLNQDLTNIINDYLMPTREVIEGNKYNNMYELNIINETLNKTNYNYKNDRHKFMLFEIFHNKTNDYLTNNFNYIREELPFKYKNMKDLLNDKNILILLKILKDFKKFGEIVQYSRYYEFTFAKQLINHVLYNRKN